MYTEEQRYQIKRLINRLCIRMGSSKAVADKVNVTRSTIANWKAGRQRISLQHCHDLMALDNSIKISDLRPDLEEYRDG